MDKRESCKICGKRFACRKAMGGHMRSHLAKLPVPPKPRSLVEPSSAPVVLSSSSSLSFNSTREGMHAYRRRSVAVSTIPDGESEIESPKMNPTGRRSGRRRRREVVGVVAPPPPPQPPTVVVAETDSVSSVSENISVYEVAMWLMLLSRDKWPHQLKRKLVTEYQEEEEVGEDEAEKEAEAESEAEGGDEVTYVDGRAAKQKTFQCEKCMKTFPTYQALGGHKASHKKIKINPKREGSVAAHNIQTTFECEFCGRVFESGQALGGHKKVHISYLQVNPNAIADANSMANFSLDLNLPPAPEEKSSVSQL